MADDPTVTGAEEARGKAPGVLAEEKFELRFECELDALEVGPSHVTLRLFIRDRSDLPGLHLGHNGTLTVPATAFPDEQKRAEWIESSLTAFKNHLAATMMHEAALSLADAGNYYLDYMGIDPIPTTKKELVKIHLNETEKRVAGFMGAKGRRSHWTRAGLEKAIGNAFASVRKHERNYAGVVKALKVSHPSKAPDSVPALKQLVRRHGVDWKKLKSNS